MKTNEGTLDRTVRVILGLVLIGVGYSMNSWWGAVGLIPLVTGLVGWCPLYAIAGFSTCKVKA